MASLCCHTCEFYMYIICVWAKSGITDQKFEKDVPLNFLGNWLKSKGSTESFEILFLYGKSHLSEAYLNQLQAFEHFNLYSYEKEFNDLISQYQQLLQFGQYEANCFLRWLIIEKHLEQKRYTGHMIHIDGDVLFNALPEEIAAETRDFTFTLQGCPAFVSIRNYQWFEDYRRHLNEFTRQIEPYSAQAWQQREGWKTSNQTKWAGSRYRPVITSDQDLISHLIHTDNIVQDDPARFVKQSSLYYCANPIYIPTHSALQLKQYGNLHFTAVENVCYLNNRKLAIWHFQSNFVRYMNHFLFLQKLRYPFRIPNELETSTMNRTALKIISKLAPLSRLEIYSQIQELNPAPVPGGISFKEVFNKDRFWKKEVFAI